MAETLLCKDCRHHAYDGYIGEHLCLRAGLREGKTSKVDGERKPVEIRCDRERDQYDWPRYIVERVCGEKAQHWEKQPPKRSMWDWLLKRTPENSSGRACNDGKGEVH